MAASQRLHEHHERARDDVRRRLGRGEQMVLSTHVLIETYAVLTRQPPPQRVSPSIALSAINVGFIARGRVVGLSPEESLAVLLSAPTREVVGGRIYDALIAETARQAKVDVILTFNVRHFTGLAPGIVLTAPGAP